MNNFWESIMGTLSRVWIFGLFLALAVPGTVLAKGSIDAGRLKASTCMGCHGIPTYDRAYPSYDVPKLGGQHKQYILKALKDYRASKRNFPTMHAQASELNKQDRQDVAAFLSQKKSEAFPSGKYTPVKNFTVNDTYKAGQKLSKPCAACHGKAGHSTTALFPILAGQYKSYLMQALKDYRSGKRESAIMNGMAASLSDQQIEQLASFFSSQPTNLYTPSVENER